MFTARYGLIAYIKRIRICVWKYNRCFPPQTQLGFYCSPSVTDVWSQLIPVLMCGWNKTEYPPSSSTTALRSEVVKSSADSDRTLEFLLLGRRLCCTAKQTRERQCNISTLSRIHSSYREQQKGIADGSLFHACLHKRLWLCWVQRRGLVCEVTKRLYQQKIMSILMIISVITIINNKIVTCTQENPSSKAKTGHGQHLQIFISLYYVYCLCVKMWCNAVLCVLFVCKCVLYCCIVCTVCV
jgi:hypothetical protein